MDHGEARRLASSALDAALGADQERDLAVHLVGCPDCKGFYESLRLVGDELRRLTLPAPAPQAVAAASQRATALLRGGEEQRAAVDMAEPQEEVAGTGKPDAPSSLDDDTGPLAATPLEDEDAPTATDVASWSGTTVGEPWPADRDPDDAATEPPSPDQGPPASETVPAAAVEPPPQSPPEAEEAAAPQTEPAHDDLLGPRLDVDEQRSRLAPWVAGLAAAVALAVLAGLLVARGPTLDTETGLPTPEQVRARLGALFDDLQSLKASFAITRLDLYRVEQAEGSLVYSFSNGTYNGRIVYEEPERLREEIALEVQGDTVVRYRTVRTPEETRTLSGEGETATLAVVANPAFGPPDGELQPELGMLERAWGSAARLLIDSRDLEVIEQTTHGEREVVHVSFSVLPSELTRADRIDMLIDTANFVPRHIRRSISRADARVLGPPDVLTDDALDTAFADRDRLTTETVDLENVVLNDIVTPGEFVLDVPGDADPQMTDASFQRTSLAELAEMLEFDPLLPASLPQGFRERAHAVYTGEAGDWGPNQDYPAPEGIAQSVFSDGKTTVVVSQRLISDGPFEIEGSPLQAVGLPLLTRSVVRGGRQLTYAVSPEVPPHVFGFVDHVFILVTGYAPQDDLLRIAASLQLPGPAGEAPPAPAP